MCPDGRERIVGRWRRSGSDDGRGVRRHHRRRPPSVAAAPLGQNLHEAPGTLLLALRRRHGQAPRARGRELAAAHAAPGDPAREGIGGGRFVGRESRRSGQGGRRGRGRGEGAGGGKGRRALQETGFFGRGGAGRGAVGGRGREGGGGELGGGRGGGERGRGGGEG